MNPPKNWSLSANFPIVVGIFKKRRLVMSKIISDVTMKREIWTKIIAKSPQRGVEILLQIYSSDFPMSLLSQTIDVN